jgi:uncharacterized protein (TIGR03435 family)
MTKSAAVGVAVAALALSLTSDVSHGQNAAFEVMSIKRNQLGGPGSFGVEPGGRLAVVNMPVGMLIWISHKVQPFQIVGAPDWINAERYDIRAKPAEGTSSDRDTLLTMVRQMLSDRFQLKVRAERREMPIYKLLRVDPDAAVARTMKRSQANCAAQAARGGPPSATPPPGGRCTVMIRPGGGATIVGYPMTELARMLGPMVNRVVADETGLEGNWDLELEFEPPAPPVGFGPPAEPPGPAGDAPSIFTALREQLGLKLESARGPVDVFLIDRIERPSED